VCNPDDRDNLAQPPPLQAKIIGKYVTNAGLDGYFGFGLGNHNLIRSSAPHHLSLCDEINNGNLGGAAGIGGFTQYGRCKDLPL
jgi:hypothetical protein